MDIQKTPRPQLPDIQEEHLSQRQPTTFLLTLSPTLQRKEFLPHPQNRWVRPKNFAPIPSQTRTEGYQEEWVPVAAQWFVRAIALWSFTHLAEESFFSGNFDQFPEHFRKLGKWDNRNLFLLKNVFAKIYPKSFFDFPGF